MLYRMEDLNDPYPGVFNVETDLYAGCAVVNFKPFGPFRWVPTWLRDGRLDELAGNYQKAKDQKRVEHRLGTLLADAAQEIARARTEYQNGRLTPQTGAEFGRLMFEIYGIWQVSRFGCWDRKRGIFKPYFAGAKKNDARMELPAAARHYGLEELRMRFPNASEAALRDVLSLVLGLMRQTLDSLVPPAQTFKALVQSLKDWERSHLQ